MATLSLASTYQPFGVKNPGITAMAACPTPGHGHLMVVSGKNNETVVYDIAAGAVVTKLGKAASNNITGAAWTSTANGNVISLACLDGNVNFWQGPTGGSVSFAAAGSIKAHGGSAVAAMVMHPLNTHGLSIGGDGAWAFWDVAAASVVISVGVGAASGTTLKSLAVHPDGMLLGVGCSDGLLRIFDVRSQSQVAALGSGVSGDNGGVEAATFSENGFYAATASAAGASLWDLRKASEEPLVKAWASGSPVTSVKFDVSGAFLASGSKDGAVRIYDTKETLAELAVLRHHSSNVSSLAWLDCARGVVSTSSSERALHVMKVK
jgi:pre-mRNA-processing factor 19